MHVYSTHTEETYYVKVNLELYVLVEEDYLCIKFITGISLTGKGRYHQITLYPYKVCHFVNQPT